MHDRSVPGSVSLLLAILLGLGCSRSNTSRPMTVAVRDKLTHLPVESALVDARTLHFFVATDIPLLGRDAILDPSPPASVRGMTGPDGTVRLNVVQRHPVRIIVVAPGYLVQVVDLVTHPARSGPGDWLDTDLGPQEPAGARRVEVRFLP
ncbi:MAG: hypothetical protein IID28_00240 [Planctomycetes bacterium]|nr:hypothetical protein [Planctomycetota bacterium]